MQHNLLNFETGILNFVSFCNLHLIMNKLYEVSISINILYENFNNISKQKCCCITWNINTRYIVDDFTQMYHYMIVSNTVNYT